MTIADLLDGGGDDKKKKRTLPDARTLVATGRQAFADVGIDPEQMLLGLGGVPSRSLPIDTEGWAGVETLVGGRIQKAATALRRMLPQGIQEMIVEGNEAKAWQALRGEGLYESDVIGPSEEDLAQQIKKVRRAALRRDEPAAYAEQRARQLREAQNVGRAKLGLPPLAESMYPGPDGIPVPGIDDILGAELEAKKLEKSVFYKLLEYSEEEGFSGRPRRPEEAINMVTKYLSRQSPTGQVFKAARDEMRANKGPDQPLAPRDTFEYFSQAFRHKELSK